MLPFWETWLLIQSPYSLGFPGGSDGKKLVWNAGDPGSIPGSGRVPWTRKWQRSPVFLLGKSRGWRSLEGSLLICSGFLFLHNLVLVGCVFLGIYSFLLEYLVGWPAIIWSTLIALLISLTSVVTFLFHFWFRLFKSSIFSIMYLMVVNFVDLFKKILTSFIDFFPSIFLIFISFISPL